MGNCLAASLSLLKSYTVHLSLFYIYCTERLQPSAVFKCEIIFDRARSFIFHKWVNPSGREREKRALWRTRLTEISEPVPLDVISAFCVLFFTLWSGGKFVYLAALFVFLLLLMPGYGDFLPRLRTLQSKYSERCMQVPPLWNYIA